MAKALGKSSWFFGDKEERRILEGDVRICESWLPFSFLKLLLDFCWKHCLLLQASKAASQKTQGRRLMMFCFSETVHKIGCGWLEGPVNTTAVAVITRMWTDAISAFGNLQKLLLSDVIMLVKVYSVLEWLVSFPGVALSQCKAHFCGAYSRSGSALLV